MSTRWRRLVPAVALATLGLVACTGPEVTTSSRATPPAPSMGTVRLTDVAAERGLDFVHGAFRFDAPADPVAMMSGGLCWLDYDGDGWMDLFIVNSYASGEAATWRDAGGLPTSALYRNDEGTFTDVTASTGTGVAVQGMGCVVADFDGDGHDDVYVTSGDENHLLWNEGDGTFTDGTAAAGVQGFAWHAGAAAGDLNGDGFVDLFVAGYVDLNNRVGDATRGFPNSYLGQRDLLYLNEGPRGGDRPTFREVGRTVGLENAVFDYGLGAVMSDLDGDGDLDLYVVNETNPNRLYANVPWPAGVAADPEGIGFRFEEVGAPSGVADPGGGMGVALGDFTAGGYPGLFVTNFNSQPHAVFVNRSDLAFTDAAPTFGVPGLGTLLTGWGVAFTDLDLDTDLDLVIADGFLPVSDLAADAQIMQALENVLVPDGTAMFRDIGAPIGLDTLGPRNARGLAVADYDNDGDPDIAVNVLGGHVILLENSGADGYWLQVDVGTSPPGTIVTATLPGGTMLRRDLVAGSSYLSGDDPRALFGLGTSPTADVTVRFPGGVERALGTVGADRIVTVEP